MELSDFLLVLHIAYVPTYCYVFSSKVKMLTAKNVENVMMMKMRNCKRPGLDVTSAGDGFTISVWDSRGSHQRRRTSYAESVRSKRKAMTRCN